MKIQNRLRRYFLVACALGVMFVASPVSAWAAKSDLEVYFIDVEGGQATLFVTPAGKSLLIDTGWPENAGRDADRIVAATRLADVTKIDYVLLTHYHNDHSGGVPQLVERIPVGTFIDHGANIDAHHRSSRRRYPDHRHESYGD